VLAPDLCASSANASPGAPDDFTMSGHVADAEAALRWAETARDELGWRRDPPTLVGHSMGAYAALRLAAERPALGVVAMSPVRSGAALIAARRREGAAALARLRAELPHAETEWPAHDLASVAGRISAPVAIVVGADDTLTPPEDARALAATLPGGPPVEILPGEHHCPAGPGYAAALARALQRIGA
jgi:pimeloyl-ACP methyl ester carboxylesterase